MGTVTVSSLSLCFGRAGSIFGQKRIYKAGVALYALSAGFGAVSQSFFTLLSARVVMAIGLAMAVPMLVAWRHGWRHPWRHSFTHHTSRQFLSCGALLRNEMRVHGHCDVRVFVSE